MPYEGAVNDVRDAIALRTPKRLPVFGCSEEFDVKWHGKWDYETLCQDGDKMAEALIASVEEFDYDWAWVQIDDCFEFEPLGVVCKGEGNILRATNGYLDATAETLAGLTMPDPRRDGRMPQKLKAIRKIRQHFGDSVVVMGSCAAPYSSVGLMWGMQETMIMGMTDIDLLRKACDFFVEYQARYIEAQVEAGAHGIWLGDCNAFSAMLSVDQYRNFAFDPCRRLVKKAHDAGAFIHLHNSEISIPHILAEAELGVDIISIGPAADIAEVRKALDGKCCFSGNLDPIGTLLRGSVAEVEKQARRIVKTCRGTGYVFNSGEMIPRDVPVENMKAMVKAAREAS